MITYLLVADWTRIFVILYEEVRGQSHPPNVCMVEETWWVLL